jgi:phosphocarrier protein
MAERNIEVINRLGLHARASARLTQLASTYRSEVWITRNGRRVNGKSIMGVMMLAAGQGSLVRVETLGEDAEIALNAIDTLFRNRFGEDA